MTFPAIGMLHAWRNLSKSIFALVSMAIATGFLAYSVSISRGYPLLYKADCRAVVGGEAVVYARGFGGALPSQGNAWEYHYVVDSPFSDLKVFHPEVMNSGYLSTAQERVAFSSSDLERLRQSTPRPVEVYPRYQLPATTVSGSYRLSSPLHGRDAALDALLTRHPGELITEGRWFEAEDETRLVAVLSDFQSLPKGVPVPTVGETVLVELPRIAYTDAGEPMLQYTRPIVVELTVIGKITAMTRLSGGGNSRPIFWELDEIQIPLSTWERLWEECGGRTYAPEQVSLIFPQQTHLKDVIAELRSALPEFAVFSVAEHFEQAGRRGLIERLDPLLEQRVVVNDAQQAETADLLLPMLGAVFLNATLVVAAHLLLMVDERRKEIAILKTVGSSRAQIVQMVLAEMALLALVGASIGYGCFLLPIMLNYAASGYGFLAILGYLLQSLALTYVSAQLFSLVLGLIPALRATRPSVAEVLNHD